MFERAYSNATMAVFALVLLLILTGCSSLSRAWLSEDAPGSEPAAATQVADSPSRKQDTTAAETPDTAPVAFSSGTRMRRGGENQERVGQLPGQIPWHGANSPDSKGLLGAKLAPGFDKPPYAQRSRAHAR